MIPVDKNFFIYTFQKGSYILAIGPIQKQNWIERARDDGGAHCYKKSSRRQLRDRRGIQSILTLETMKLIYQEYAPPEEEEILLDGIFQEAFNAKGMERIKPFSFMIKDENQTVQGGVTGTSYYGYLYVELLFVKPELRKQKFGRQLMEAVEELAKERNCSYISLTTMDWEAMPFYAKLGYQIDQTQEGFENNSKMYHMRKKIG